MIVPSEAQKGANVRLCFRLGERFDDFHFAVIWLVAPITNNESSRAL